VKEFAYIRAATVADAVAAVNEVSGARYVAGGTNLVYLMKAGVEQLTRLVDLQGLPLDRIEVTDDGGLRIGAWCPTVTSPPTPKCGAVTPR
jgi:xanthine dehydrogenase YagS FAD-binding subunit